MSGRFTSAVRRHLTGWAFAATTVTALVTALSGVGTGLRYECGPDGQVHGTCCCGPEARVTRTTIEAPCCCNITRRPALDVRATRVSDRAPASAQIAWITPALPPPLPAQLAAITVPADRLLPSVGPPPFALHCSLLL